MGLESTISAYDPMDIGRKFERLIRINSQSGKGGVAWVLKQDYGIDVPKEIQPVLGLAVQKYSESVAREISAEEVYQIFEDNFIKPDGPYGLLAYLPRHDDQDTTFIHGEVILKLEDHEVTYQADGNGPVSAFVHAIREAIDIDFKVESYHEQAVGKGADAQALAFVPLKLADGKIVYGAGIDSNIDQAAVKQLSQV